MSKVSSTRQQSGQSVGSQGDAEQRLHFFKKLQSITNKIHATSNIVDIMLGLSHDICALFNCDRLTLYAVSGGKTFIESKVKTGLNSYKDFTLPISEKSIAGYVAHSRKTVNISNVYDEEELKAHSSGLQFLQEVDKRTGYRTVQMLAGPLVDSKSGELLGVVQLINTQDGKAFSAMLEEGLKALCETLALAFAQRAKPPLAIRSKYDYLVADGILSAAELALATSSARSKLAEIEDLLVDDSQVQLADIGDSLSRFFGVPYEPFLEARAIPHGLLKTFKRKLVEHNHWLPLEEISDGLIVLATDPERIKASGLVNNFFPKINHIFRVTTKREFGQTAEQFFNTSDEQASFAETGCEIVELNRAGEIGQDLIRRASKIIADAFVRSAPDIKITLNSDQARIAHQLSNDGSLDRISGQIVIDFRFDLP